MADFNTPVVIDSGTGTIKADLAGAETPKLAFPAYVGRPKHTKAMAGATEGEHHVGNKASELKGILQLSHPMAHGRVTAWNDMQKIWQAAYNELHIVQDQHPVLLTEAPLNPRNNRAKSVEVFFESFNVPALFTQTQSILSLYASGRTTGVVVDSGDGVTCAVPVYKGFALAHAIRRMDLGGRDVTEYLQLLLRKSGANFVSSAEFDIVRDIKEKCCMVAGDINKQEEEETETPGAPTDYTLPDGRVVQVGAERFRAPELLFDPNRLGYEEGGVQHMLSEAIARCDMDLRATLYQEILLAGGGTMCEGFGQRLLSETRLLAPENIKIKIWAPPQRTLSAWKGGSILASLASFRKMVVTRKEYAEYGMSIFDRKNL